MRTLTEQQIELQARLKGPHRDGTLAIAGIPIFAGFFSKDALIVAYPPTNTIIISDRASNVNRMMRIIRRIDDR